MPFAHRRITPPVRITIEDATVDESPVIVVRVHEYDRSAKPCRVSASGTAYLRDYDGDFAMSELEEQAFLASRRPPLFDRASVVGATRADLDGDLVREFLRSVRDRDPHGLGRFTEDDELLLRAGVVDSEGVPTVAGILAMGLYPQH
ncbi:AlbA family DNA-binding domain-containing protein [Nocardia rhizosphaerae]|uniref:Helix-turn-helix domain-containing protein n=1 Tax=Nocardia rhizosphaerae TaxID=1691571 RepID=A0ABV8L9G4_9NOCA